MFERYTEDARQAVVLAQDEARSLKHNYIGTEHILLGLLGQEEGVAGRVLESMDIGFGEVLAHVRRVVGPGDEVTTGQLPFTPRSTKVLELALREALKLGHNYVGTEHILLALVRENEGVAARILLDFGADAEHVRNEVVRALPRPGSRRAGPSAAVRELLRAIGLARRLKEQAIEAHEFERGAGFRETELELVAKARELGIDPAAAAYPGSGWEYLVLELERDVSAELEAIGREAWELVLRLEDGRLVFKRPCVD